ncbi:hypothetical protein EK21DRAFT_22446, partial [Setomelanomma holmii]
PGEPHYYDTRLDRRRALVVNPLCRCSNPDSHNNAWAWAGELAAHFAQDLPGHWISWQDLSNRVLDHYRQTSISREE